MQHVDVLLCKPALRLMANDLHLWLACQLSARGTLREVVEDPRLGRQAVAAVQLLCVG